MSVQILKYQPYSSKCDIWAVGVIYYEMLHGYVPWTGRTEYEFVSNMENKPLKLDPKLSAESKDFLIKCLGIREENRISWDELFELPIFGNMFIKNVKGNQKF